MTMNDLLEDIMVKYELVVLLLSSDDALPMVEVFMEDDDDNRKPISPILTAVQTMVDSTMIKMGFSPMKSIIMKTDSGKKCMIKTLTDKKDNRFLCSIVTESEDIIAERLDAAMREIEDKIVDALSK